ncbi:MAG: ABC transporter substrate-binding protein [Clostridia bacterium]|nr:ABC transporter substrate-binding protein [Clostridia bacterium]
MKRILSILLALSMLVCMTVSFTSCSSEKKAAGDAKIGIVQPMDHTSLNQIRDTIIARLVELGYSEDQITVKNASNDASLLPSIFQSLIADGVDILIPIATNTAQVAASQTDSIPIVFSAASNPVEAGLVTAFDATDKNVTGVSDAVNVEAIFSMMQELTPNVKTVGFVYNPGEINSSTAVASAKEYCEAHNLAFKEATVSSTADIAQAVTSLVGEVDAFFTADDNTVASGMTTYAQIAIDAKLPIYVGADSMVIDGGLATVGIDYDVLAKQTAEMADRILKGAKISDTHVERVANPAKIINRATADAIGITISDAMAAEFTVID